MDDEISRQDLLELVADHYPEIGNDLLRPLLDLLTLSRQACGGDADKFLIMAVVGARTTEHADYASVTKARLMSGEPPVLPSLGTNVASIAESLGAPKETVRRKVNELIAAGWIDRQGHKLRATALAFQELVCIRAAMERLAVANFESVAALARRHGRR